MSLAQFAALPTGSGTETAPPSAKTIARARHKPRRGKAKVAPRQARSLPTGQASPGLHGVDAALAALQRSELCLPMPGPAPATALVYTALAAIAAVPPETVFVEMARLLGTTPEEPTRVNRPDGDVIELTPAPKPDGHAGAVPRQTGTWRNVTHLLDDGPLRPPDWRWRLGQYFADTGPPPQRYPLDDRVRQIMWYLWYVREPYDSWPVSGIDRQLLRQVLDLYRDPAPSAELEARVLARQDVPTIAAKLGVEPSVVSTYEELFFDVRAKLDLGMYVLANVIGPDKFDLADRPRLLKYFAHSGGAAWLEELLWFFQQTPPACYRQKVQEMGGEDLTKLRRAELLERRRWMLMYYALLLIAYQSETNWDRLSLLDLWRHPLQQQRCSD